MTMRIGLRLLGLSLLTATTVACSTSTSTEETVGSTSTSTDETVDLPWSAADPPSAWASGLTLSYIPDGFTFKWNEGHESADFHVFESADGSEFSVGRHRPASVAGEQVTRNGRVFTIVEYPRQTRIREDVDNGFSIEVVSRSLDTDTLLRIADGMSYDPSRDRCTEADDCL